MKSFFEVTVGGKHCVGRQPDGRGAEKGCIPHKARFPAHLFGLARVPAKRKEARMWRASVGLCGAFRSRDTYVLLYRCHYQNIGPAYRAPCHQIQRNPCLDQLESLCLHTCDCHECCAQNQAVQIRERR